MKWNVGGLDRTIRFFVAIIAGIMAMSGTVRGILLVILIVISVVSLVTGLMGFCGLYKILGISTVEKRK